MATMADVARMADVSIKTVSNVVNGYPYVRDTTRARVLAAIDHLGYEVNSTARSLRSGRTGMIRLAVPELGQPYFAELAEEVLAAGRARGLHVLIECTGFSREAEIQALHDARRGLVDGLLFNPASMTQDDAHLLTADVPMVLLGEQVFSPAFDHVTMHNVEGARAATDLLLRVGRRRIAVVGAPLGGASGTARLRFEGYRSALAARGIELDERLLADPRGVWHRANGARAIAHVLDSGVAPDGVVAFNDALALGAMFELQRRGLRVPQDVAVVGFDDTEDAQYTLPTLTSVDAGRREIAEIAVDLLCRRIAEVDEPAPTVLHLARMHVVERESTPSAVSSLVRT